jgi:HAD superfamily hydrolase (TIGR01509 family)
MIRAIIFDFFGVLVGEGFDATYRSAGGDPIKDKQFIQKLLDSSNRGRISSEEFRAKICHQLGITIDQYKEAMARAETPNLELFDYIKTLRPNYKTAILSNVSKGGLERRIKREKLEEYFDVLVVSGDLGYVKPEAEAYEFTAKQLGVAPEQCIFVDDRIGYVEGAAALGMKAIKYINFKQMKSEIEKILANGSDN